PDDLLGGLYVLEGSRLGGTMLARSVGPGLPQHFLGSAPPPGGWKGLITLLEQHLITDDQRQRAGRSAIRTFDCFFEAATRTVRAR
ncbi:MAG: heme oxygenase, partial [Sphingomicrobium sp.]